jgi:GR25 family glycosyltransferase involved in LPS biosynthesis
MRTLNDYFDKIYCINLDDRKDRWESCQTKFNNYKLNVERISAIKGSDLNLDWPPEIKEGAVGCSLSHLFAMKMAKHLNLNNYLVLEDDIEFDENFNEKFSEIYNNQVPNNWDMLYLGGQHFHGMNLQQIAENVFKCEYTLTTHSFAVKNTVYDLFIDKLIDITKPCDVHFAQSHRTINAYVIVPHLTWQGESYSDVQNANVDYTFLKQHRYPQWGKP